MAWYEDPDWGRTFEGRELSLYASSKETLQGNLSPILFIGGVHGDEPEGVELAKKTLDWLRSESYQKHPGSNKTPWILIPCLNLDGYLRNERVNAQGIDLNRNFPSKNWQPRETKDRYYSGSKPKESPEVSLLVDLIQSSKPQVIIHCHSWEPCIVCTGPKDHPYATALALASGYPLKNDIGYPTPGSLGDYGWMDLRIPVICIEEQEHENLNLIWGHFKSGIQQIFLNVSP